MKLPTFMIVGAAKSGTTSLMRYLSQHPDVFVPVTKEPNYFMLSGQQDNPKGPASPYILRHMIYNWSCAELSRYEALFADAGAAKASGEGSVRYLYSREAPKRIHDMLPDIRLVVVLRDPVARLFSHYNMNRQIQLEPLDLRDALDAEDDRVAQEWGWDWHYRRVSLYGAQLQRWFDQFDREQIQVHFYDDFVANPNAVFSEICRHIGVDPDFRPDMRERGMVSTRPRNLWLDRQLNWPSRLRYRLLRRPFGGITKPLMTRLNRWNSLPAPKLDAATRAEIAPLFTEDLALLSALLKRDVPWT